MSVEIKATVEKEKSFDLLEIRLGRIISVTSEEAAAKKSYRLEIDFGKYGRKTSVGRFTYHSPVELTNRLVMGVLNFEPRQIGNTLSEVLVLGVQIPGQDSGEATIMVPLTDAKIGSKLF
jgi:tRNA-binding protein